MIRVVSWTKRKGRGGGGVTLSVTIFYFVCWTLHLQNPLTFKFWITQSKMQRKPEGCHCSMLSVGFQYNWTQPYDCITPASPVICQDCLRVTEFRKLKTKIMLGHRVQQTKNKHYLGSQSSATKTNVILSIRVQKLKTKVILGSQSSAN